MKSVERERFHPTFIMEVLLIVDKEIDSQSAKAKGFTFTNEYKIAISVTACGYSVKVFERMLKEWRTSNIDDIISGQKEKIIQHFEDHCFKHTLQ